MKTGSAGPLINSMMFLMNGMDATFFFGSLKKFFFQSLMKTLSIPSALSRLILVWGGPLG